MFLGGHGFNILIHKCFQRDMNRFISLVFKVKQQKANQLPCMFFKFYIDQFFNQFLLFSHFLIFLVYETYTHSRGE